jgi:hypothetical protein
MHDHPTKERIDKVYSVPYLIIIPEFLKQYRQGHDFGTLVEETPKERRTKQAAASAAFAAASAAAAGFGMTSSSSANTNNGDPPTSVRTYDGSGGFPLERNSYEVIIDDDESEYEQLRCNKSKRKLVFACIIYLTSFT